MLVGGKGGYINSLVAQIVGINGKVVTISANQEILDVCKERVDSSSPFKQTMEWKHIKSVQNTSEIKKEFIKVPFRHDYCMSSAVCNFCCISSSCPLPNIFIFSQLFMLLFTVVLPQRFQKTLLVILIVMVEALLPQSSSVMGACSFKCVLSVQKVLLK